MSKGNFGRRGNHIFIGIAIVCTAILIGIFSSEGFADFSSSTTTQSLVGVRTNLDSSFNVRSLQITFNAANTISGAAYSGGNIEIDNPRPAVRLNTLNSGDSYYLFSFIEASPQTSGTWQVKLYREGVQVGPTVTLVQNSADNSSEGADIYYSLGSSIPRSFFYHIEIVKTA